MEKKNKAFRAAMMIKELYSKTTNIISDNLKESGLTHQQCMVIQLIAHKKEMTITELCKEMSLAKGTISGIVQRLEKLGYLEKEKRENDKRNTYIKFSSKGLEFSNNFKKNMSSSFENIFINCNDEDMDDMIVSLRNMLNKIEGNEK